MRYNRTTVSSATNILLNDHYVAIPYDCSELTDLATNGVIAAGTIIPSNDGDAVGVLLTDVTLADNPNGAVVVHGFIDADKIPEAPTDNASLAMDMVKFISTSDN